MKKQVSHHVLVDIHTHHHVLVSTIDLQLFMRLWREKQVEILSEFLVFKRENMLRFQHKPAFTPEFKSSIDQRMCREYHLKTDSLRMQT